MDFRPPKPSALSDEEIQLDLNDPGATIGESLELLAQQEQLRLVDRSALEAWICELKADGSADAVRAISLFLKDVMPVSESQDQPSQSESAELFTSEINTLSPKRPRKRGRGSIFFYYRTLITASVVALINLLLLNWLQATLLDSILGIFGGVVLAHLIGLVIKTHGLHPLLRSASVFGGLGVYLSSGIILGLVAVIYSGAYVSESESTLNWFQIGDFRMEFAVLGVVIFAVTQLSSPLMRKFLPGLVIFAGLGIAGATLSYEFSSVDFIVSQDALISAIGIGFTTVVLVIFGQPHDQETTLTLGFSALCSIALSIAALGFLAGSGSSGWGLVEITAITGLLTLLALSGFDLAGATLGRFAGAAFLFGPVLASWFSEAIAPALALVTCATVLMLLDQLWRRSGLHVSSLNTRYGFYGSFQFLSWLALILAAVSALEPIRRLWAFSLDFSEIEWALLSGLVVGVVIGLLRIPIIRSQDEELKMVEGRNIGTKNLLGL